MVTFSGFTDPGSTTSTALDTASFISGGSIASTADVFQNSIGGSDFLDIYKFTVSAASSSSSIVSLSLSGLSSNADLYLLNSSGATITTSQQSGNTSESIRLALAAGTYYAQIYNINTTTSYDLSLSAEPTTDSGRFSTDNTIATAYTVPTPFSSSFTSYNTTDFVGDKTGISDISVVQDVRDFYKIDLAANGSLNISLNGLTADANLVLLRSGPSVIQSSNNSGTTAESIVTGSLTQGSYYINVYTNTSNYTNYNLQVAFTPDIADNAGNTLATARNITNLPVTYSDFVNSADNLDYYRLDLTTLVNSDALVNISLTPTTTNGNADLAILDSGGFSLQSSAQSGSAVETIRRSLKSGVYYILVTPGTGSATNYDLSVSTTLIGTDQAPNSLGTAKNLGTFNGNQSASDFVGNIDTVDWYAFTLSENSEFTIDLSNLSDNADVQLVGSNASVIQTSANAGTSSESINAVLSAGNYYVRVYTSGLANTFYNLNLSATFQPIVPTLFDINVGAGNSNPDNLTAWNTNLYFTANDGAGAQLWKSDGTTVTKITNLNPGAFNPGNLIVFSNKLYFTADDGTNGRELWSYNGTTAQIVGNINPAAASSNPSNLTIVGGKLFFTADNGTNGTELWTYDGTTLKLVKDINLGVDGSSPSNLTAFNGQLYFTANNTTYGRELWYSDGSDAGTQVIDVTVGNTGSSPLELTVVGTNLYFLTDDRAKLWKYVPGTLSLVRDSTNNVLDRPYSLSAAGSNLYFVTDSNNDFRSELWKSAGTTNSLVRANLTQAPNISYDISNFKAIGSTLYFTTADNGTGLELWQTDGSDANTKLVKDIYPGSYPSNPNLTNDSFPSSLVNFNGTLYFAASDSSSREVWKSDGTASGTKKISNTFANGNANPEKLTAVGTRLFFTATNGTNGTELFVISPGGDFSQQIKAT